MDVYKRTAIAMSGLLLTGAAALTLAATPASADDAAHGHGHGGKHEKVEFVGNNQNGQQNQGFDQSNKNRQKAEVEDEDK